MHNESQYLSVYSSYENDIYSAFYARWNETLAKYRHRTRIVKLRVNFFSLINQYDKC